MFALCGKWLTEAGNTYLQLHILSDSQNRYFLQ